MIRLLERIEWEGTILRNYLALRSARDDSGLASEIQSIAHAFAAILEAGSATRDAAARCWICVDLNANQSAPNAAYAIVQTIFAVETRDVDTGAPAVYHLAATTTLLDPSKFGWWTAGRPSFRDRLRREYAKSWRDSVGVGSPEHAPTFLANTLVWPFGEPTNASTISPAGDLIPARAAFDKPEATLVSGQTFIGMPEPAPDPEDAELDALWESEFGENESE